MKRNRFWVGHNNGKRTAFTFVNPTIETHGDMYKAVTGPFKTRRGAEYFANNPYYAESIDCVDEMARWTLEMKKKGVLV